MNQRKAWIIGASSGIGSDLARELVSRNFDVTISARNEVALREVAGNTMTVLPCDISSDESVAQAADKYLDTQGDFDFVIVMAGYWKQMSAIDFDLEVFKQHNDVNVVGLARVIEAVLPRMRLNDKGTLVGVSSVAGYRGFPGSAGYGPSKAAQLNLLESIRADLAHTNVKVLTVSPGFVETPMTSTNTFPMPFIISSEKAAKYIAAGLERNKAEIVFPLPMSLMMKFAKLVPVGLWPKLFKRK